MSPPEMAKLIFYALVLVLIGLIWFDNQAPFLPDTFYCVVGAGYEAYIDKMLQNFGEHLGAKLAHRRGPLSPVPKYVFMAPCGTGLRRSSNERGVAAKNSRYTELGWICLKTDELALRRR
jgi:hypothetical protein